MHSCRVACSSLGSCFTVFLFDQITKQTFFDGLDAVSGFSLLGGFITQTSHRNSGMSFDIPIPNWIILSLTIIALIFILRGVNRAMWSSSLWDGLMLGILLGGALGNFIDRWTYQYVRDWILLFHRSAFNVADIAILIGLSGYLFLQYQATRQPAPSSPHTQVIH